MKIDISIDEYIGRKAKSLRDERKLRQEVIAKVLAISSMQLSFLERGRRSWKMTQVYELARYFKVKIEYFTS